MSQYRQAQKMESVGQLHLAEQIAETRPGMKVLYMSGYTSDTVLRHGVLEAQMPFLNKPFTAAALLRKVREVFERSRHPFVRQHRVVPGLFLIRVAIVALADMHPDPDRLSARARTRSRPKPGAWSREPSSGLCRKTVEAVP
jgi:hypothetical protein